MAEILWLASYPKSGNTWLRAFLANYLGDGATPAEINRLAEFSYSDARESYYVGAAGRPVAGTGVDVILRLRPRVLQALATARPGHVFVKTHWVLASIEGIATIPAELSAGAIYVARNPLDTCVSFAHHFGLPLANAVKAIAFAGLKTTGQAGQVAQIISDWSSHAQSWLDPPDIAVHLIRYEDMHAVPQETFGGALRFLGLEPVVDRLDAALSRSAFAVLAEQERRSGFIEASRKSQAFFRRGKVGAWRDALTEEQAQSIVERHRPMMRRLGYLDANDALTV